MNNVTRLWTSYWFRPASLFRLAICRVVIVAFQLVYLTINVNGFIYERFQYLTNLPDFLYDPLPILRLFIWPFGVGYRPGLVVLLLIYSITMVTGLFGLIGFRTNLNLLIFAAGNIFIHAFNYSFGEFHHPDAIMMIALAVLALSPSGNVLSLDDLWCCIQTNALQGEFSFQILLSKRVFLQDGRFF